MLHIALLGGPALRRDGRVVALPDSRRVHELVAWLALHPGTHSRSRVAGALRPDATEDAARQTLRQALWGLRAALGDHDTHLEVGRDRIGFRAGTVETDVDVLRVGAARGDRVAFAALEAPLVPDLDADWAAEARDRLTEEVSGLARQLAMRAEAAGDLNDALHWASRLADRDPLSETAQREHIRLLAAAGDRAAALTAADALRRRLADELGVPPSAETRRLLDEVLVDDGPRGAPVPIGRPRGQMTIRVPPLPGPLVERSGGPLVGRHAELAMLRDTWGAARRDTSRLVLVSGEPGIGKTRLASAFARELHAAGTPVLFGRCDADALSVYQPFGEALDRAVRDGLLRLDAVEPAYATELARLLPSAGPGGDTPAPTTVDTDRLRLFEAVRAALTGVVAARPALVVVDDLHWATPATVALLTHLARTCDVTGLMVVGTYRDTIVADPGHPLAEALAEWRRRDDVRVLPLPPLPGEAVARFVEWCVDHPDTELARALHARTGGNPLFLVESLRDIAERAARHEPVGDAVPTAVRDVIEQRIARLGPDAVPVLRAAAIVGTEFAVGDVEAMLDAPGDAALDVLEAATRARLVRELPDTGRLAFTHALVCDAILSGMSAARRGRLHLRLGEHLAGRDAPPADVARHMLAAAPEGDARLRAEWVTRAAGDAVRLAAYEQAQDLFRRALDDPALPDDVRATLLAGLGDALDRAGRRDAARQAFAEAADLARGTGDTDLLARAALGHAGHAVALTAPDAATEALLRAAIGADPDAATRARLHAALSLERYYADPVEADRLSVEALEMSDAAADPATRARVLSARHVVLWRADGAHTRLGVADEMCHLAVAAGDPVAELQARNWRVIDLMELARLPEAVAEIDAYADRAERFRLPQYAWYVPLWRGAVAIMHGRFAEAREHTRMAAELGALAEDPNTEGHVWIQSHHALLEEGRDREIDMDALHDRAQRSAAGMGAWLGLLTLLYARRRDVDTARRLFADLAADGFAQLPRGANWHAACEAAEACALVGDTAAAPYLRDLLGPHAHLTPVIARGVGVYRPVAYYLGLLAETLGDHAGAAAHMRHALTISEAVGAEVWARDIRARL